MFEWQSPIIKHFKKFLYKIQKKVLTKKVDNNIILFGGKNGGIQGN